MSFYFFLITAKGKEQCREMGKLKRDRMGRVTGSYMSEIGKSENEQKGKLY